MKTSNTANRLHELINFFGVSQIDVSKRTGIPKSTISMYFKGVREPRQDRVQIIAEAYGVDETWLMGYDVPMNKNQSRIIAEIIGEYVKENDKRFFELADIYSKLDEDGKNAYLIVGRKMLR